MREAEQVESARLVGVPVVEFLGLPDGIVEYGVPLRRTLAEVIRRHRPDIVVTGNFRDSWGGQSLNQADHIAVGRGCSTRPGTPATGGSSPSSSRVTSSRGAACARCGPPAPPRPGTRSTRPRPFDAGVASLEAHGAYIDGLGWEDFDPREFLEGMARQTGQGLGVAFAAPFEVYPLGWGD